MTATRADIAFSDADTRCEKCGKRHMIDVGADVFGNLSGHIFCPNCSMPPQAAHWERGLLAAVATVAARRGGTR